MSASEIVSKYLRLNRAIGRVMELIQPIEVDNDFKKAMAELEAADEDLQKYCYEIGGPK